MGTWWRGKALVISYKEWTPHSKTYLRSLSLQELDIEIYLEQVYISLHIQKRREILKKNCRDPFIIESIISTASTYVLRHSYFLFCSCCYLLYIYSSSLKTNMHTETLYLSTHVSNVTFGRIKIKYIYSYLNIKVHTYLCSSNYHCYC